MSSFLSETPIINFSHPDIQSVREKLTGFQSDQEKAIFLFHFTRDNWKYYPYHIHLEAESYKASYLVERSYGHCIDKSILLIALLRAEGIPARLRLAKVRNHIATEKFTEILGSDIIAPHGLVDVFLNEKWLKCSNAFNSELCQKLNVSPIEFDGENDAVFQEFSSETGQFMEYIEDLGAYEDVPVDFIKEVFISSYPKLYNQLKGHTSFDIGTLL